MTVTIRQSKQQITKIVSSQAPLSLMMWGPPGVGKTSIVSQTAQELGIGFKSVIAHLYTPPDVLGLPYIHEGKAHYAPPTAFPDEAVDGARGIFFIDELPNCVPAMMSAWGIIILERSTKHYKFPPGWAIVCAGNPPGSRSGSARLIGPLENRLMHVNVAPSSDEFFEYAMSRGLNRFVTSFLDFRKGDALLRYDGKSQDFGFPSPRSWERVSEILALDWTGSEHERDELIRGTIGDGMATEFLGYLRIYANLPSFEDIIADRVDYSKLKVDVISAIMGSLISYCIDDPTQKHVDQVLTVALSMPDEWKTFLVNRLWSYGQDKARAKAGQFTQLVMASPVWKQHLAKFVDLMKISQQ